jgi:hypothetical protein
MQYWLSYTGSTSCIYNSCSLNHIYSTVRHVKPQVEQLNHVTFEKANFGNREHNSWKFQGSLHNIFIYTYKYKKFDYCYSCNRHLKEISHFPFYSTQRCDTKKQNKAYLAGIKSFNAINFRNSLSWSANNEQKTKSMKNTIYVVGATTRWRQSIIYSWR